MDNKITDGLDFKASLPIQIRFNDIDALGHINNNIYLSFFDLAKADYFDKMRGSAVSWTEGAVVIARLEIDFLAPTFYKEEIVVESKIVRIGNKSGEFIQQLKNKTTGSVKCICKSIFVYIDAESQKPTTVPHAWRELVSKFEGVEF